MNYSNPVWISARKYAQKAHLLRPVVGLFRRITRKQYEERFHEACLAAVRPGDIVWDIGANVGLYTREFALRAGETGRVVAFEPSPRALEGLRKKVSGMTNVVIEECALSDCTGTAKLYSSSLVVADGFSSLAVVDGLSRKLSEGTLEIYEVQVLRGESFAAVHGVPAVIKIDVEGFEPEVIRGLSNCIQTETVRTVLIEMHFTALNDRNLSLAPREIARFLESAGYRLSWTDPSHLVATRAD